MESCLQTSQRVGCPALGVLQSRDAPWICPKGVVGLKPEADLSLTKHCTGILNKNTEKSSTGEEEWFFSHLGFPAVYCCSNICFSLFHVFSQPGIAARCSVCLRASLPPCLQGAVYSGGEKFVTENHAVLFQLPPVWVSGPHARGCPWAAPALAENKATLGTWAP